MIDRIGKRRFILLVVVIGVALIGLMFAVGGGGNPAGNLSAPVETVDTVDGSGQQPGSSTGRSDTPADGGPIAYPVDAAALTDAAAVGKQFLEAVNSFDPDETEEAHVARIQSFTSSTAAVNAALSIPRGPLREQMIAAGPRTAEAVADPTAVMVSLAQITVKYTVTIEGGGAPASTSTNVVTLMQEGGRWTVYESVGL